MKVLIGTNNKGKVEGANRHLKNFTRMYDLTREAFIMALTEFINGDIWRD